MTEEGFQHKEIELVVNAVHAKGRNDLKSRTRTHSREEETIKQRELIKWPHQHRCNELNAFSPFSTNDQAIEHVTRSTPSYSQQVCVQHIKQNLQAWLADVKARLLNAYGLFSLSAAGVRARCI